MQGSRLASDLIAKTVEEAHSLLDEQ
jgi:hypothetical protein